MQTYMSILWDINMYLFRIWFIAGCPGEANHADDAVLGMQL